MTAQYPLKLIQSLTKADLVAGDLVAYDGVKHVSLGRVVGDVFTISPEGDAYMEALAKPKVDPVEEVIPAPPLEADLPVVGEADASAPVLAPGETEEDALKKLLGQ